MQIQTVSTGSTQWNGQWWGNGGQGNANDGEHKCIWRGGDANKCGRAMAGVEPACGNGSIESSSTAATTTVSPTSIHYPKTRPPTFVSQN